jgi:hypothetical protein
MPKENITSIPKSADPIIEGQRLERQISFALLQMCIASLYLLIY